MVQTRELVGPVTFQMKLPRENMEEIERIAAEEIIPKSSVARRFILAGMALASGVSSAPATSTERTEDVQNIRHGKRNGN